MTWTAVVVSAALVATPTSTRFNLEPVFLGGSGLVVGALGGLSLVLAERTFQALQSVDGSGITSREQALERLAFTQQLRDRGTTETKLGVSLLLVGAAFLIGSVLWFVIEGPETAVSMVTDALRDGAIVRF